MPPPDNIAEVLSLFHEETEFTGIIHLDMGNIEEKLSYAIELNDAANCLEICAINTIGGKPIAFPNNARK